MSTTIAYLPTVRSEESIIRHGVIDLTQFCEREGLDPKWLLGPDPEGLVRKLKAASEAGEREEKQRGGKLLQFRA